MYANVFFKESSHNYNNFFSSVVTSTNEKQIKAKINKLNKEIMNLSQELTIESTKMYQKDFTPAFENYIIIYQSQRNYDEFYFDLVSGVLYDSTKELDSKTKRIFVSSKRDNVTILYGYCYPLGAVIYRTYSYSINPTNTKLNSSLVEEYLIPIFEPVNFYAKFDEKSKFKGTLEDNAINFLNVFYGVEKDYESLSFNFVKERYRRNKSFEIIYKECNDKDELKALLRIDTDKAVPIHTLIGCKKDEYEELHKLHLIPQFIEIQQMLNNNSCYKDFKTIPEIIQFMEKCEHWKSDLDFYKIQRASNLAKSLIEYYFTGTNESYSSSIEIFKKYYSFGKFVKYVVNESINQGYTRIQNFIIKLRDYLNMCEGLDITPTLYSNYLAITHDITARNHSITISENQELIFKNRYNGFESYIGKNYIVVAPKDTKDIMEEGDKLNHCVASYIKKVLDGKSKILFLRKVDEIEKRLVTVEIVNNVVCQAKGLGDRDITNEERQGLIDFCMKRGYKFSV